MKDVWLRRVLEPLHRRIKMMITRGVLHLVDASMLMQTVQVEFLSGEVLDRVEHFEPYGFTANPKPGAEVLAAGLAGRRAHTIAISVADRRYRLTGLAQGEVAVYDDLGQKIVLTRNGILIQSPLVTVDAEMAVFTGDVQIDGEMHADGNVSTDSDVLADGDVLANGDVVAGTVSLQNHLHIGSPTAATGPKSNTGAPIP